MIRILKLNCTGNSIEEKVANAQRINTKVFLFFQYYIYFFFLLVVMSRRRQRCKTCVPPRVVVVVYLFFCSVAMMMKSPCENGVAATPLRRFRSGRPADRVCVAFRPEKSVPRFIIVGFIRFSPIRFALSKWWSRRCGPVKCRCLSTSVCYVFV